MSRDSIPAAEAVENRLVQRILDGELSPGTHLREVELCEQYKVGRHTLRTAFAALAREGLIAKVPNRGVFVRELTDSDLREIYDFRTAIEAQAFRTLAHRRYVPLAASKAINSLQLLDAGTPQRDIAATDLAFHSAIVHATGNSRLIRAHDSLRTELLLVLAQLATHYATNAQLAAEHNDLLSTIAHGDPDKAETAIRTHLEHAADWLISHGATRASSA